MLLYFLLQGQKAENLRGGAVRLLELLVDAAHPFYGFVCLEQGVNKRAEGARGHHARSDLAARIEQNKRDDHRAQQIHQRRSDHKRTNPAHVFPQQPAGPFFEPGDLEALHAKRLHHAIAAERLLQNLAELAETRLARFHRAANAFAEFADRQEAQPAKATTEASAIFQFTTNITTSRKKSVKI